MVGPHFIHAAFIGVTLTGFWKRMDRKSTNFHSIFVIIRLILICFACIRLPSRIYPFCTKSRWFYCLPVIEESASSYSINASQNLAWWSGKAKTMRGAGIESVVPPSEVSEPKRTWVLQIALDGCVSKSLRVANKPVKLKLLVQRWCLQQW